MSDPRAPSSTAPQTSENLTSLLPSLPQETAKTFVERLMAQEELKDHLFDQAKRLQTALRSYNFFFQSDPGTLIKYVHAGAIQIRSIALAHAEKANSAETIRFLFA